MGHLGRRQNADQKVMRLGQEQLERRSTPSGILIDVPIDPPPTETPSLPDDGAETPAKRVPSPPCYRVNIRILRNL